MNQANGDSYIVLWFFLKDMAGTVNDNGLVYVSGQEAMTTQLIAKCLHRRRPFIEKGLALLEKLELIERDGNGMIRIAIWDELQDFQRDERKREQTKNGSAVTVRGSGWLSRQIKRWIQKPLHP